MKNPYIIPAAIIGAAILAGFWMLKPPPQPPVPPTAKAPDISIATAAYDGNIEVVKQHLAAGTDVNEKSGWHNSDEMTLLHVAAMQGHKELAELLIAEGADVNATNDINGGTPLNLAIHFKHTEIAALLRKHGGKANKEREAAGK